MLLKQMKYFVSVVKNNSFTVAAEECYISQSAISQQIKILEDEIGTELLKRENRHFTLTPAGEYFYKQSLAMIDEEERIKQTTLRIANQDNNRLRVGYINCYGGLEMHIAIAEFASYHPNMDIDIVTGNHEKLYELMKNNKVDLVLNDQRRALSNEYINFHLFTCYSYIEISERSSLNGLKEVSLEELKQVPCILVASEDQQEIEKEYYQNTLGFSGNIIFVENLEQGRVLVAGNKGFMPIEYMPNMKSNGGRIVSIPLIRNGQQIERNYYAFWKKESTNVYKEEFAKILHDTFKKSE